MLLEFLVVQCHNQYEASICNIESPLTYIVQMSQVHTLQ